MITNRQSRVSVPTKELANFFARARRVLQIPAGSVTVCLVTSTQIARWNRAYRGKRGPTDVLSFPVEARPMGRRKARSSAKSVAYLGDIAIAPAVARRNARRFGRTFAQEMRILILHGILHLMGYDHETDTGQMDRRERLLRRKLGLA